MRILSKTALFPIAALLLQGCSFFGASQNTHERIPASAITESVLNERGLYPESLIGRNQIIPGKLAIYFNLPPYISPGGVGLTEALTTHINNAKKSVKMAVFQFNQKEIFEALKKAASRGVKISISTDLCYSGKAGYSEYFEDLRNHLVQSGQEASQILDDGTASCETMFNHNKYFIFDDEIAWFGSFNPTNHGAVENVELAISLKDKEAVKILNLDFEQLIAGNTKVKKKGVYKVVDGSKENIQALDDKEIKALNQKGIKITYPSVTVGENSFEFILSPKVKSLTRIVEEVYGANKEILFSSFAIADQMLISAIINKHKGRNESPVLLLPHPSEATGVVLRKNGSKEDAGEEIRDESLKKQIQQTVKSDLDQTLKSSKNYQTPKGELKGVFRYFYPISASVKKVFVEGIFNSKVIEEENTKGRLENAGIKLYQSNMNGELHNKLFLIDEAVTIFGSHNFSQSAENSNDELTVIVKSAGIARFLKEELYQKTKFFAVPTHESIKVPTLAITEIMSESPYQFKQVKRLVDAGEYVEVYNFGDREINLLGFRLDDRFFPSRDGESMELSTNPGFSGDLVGFIPNAEKGKIGTTVFEPKATLLKPKQTALIVGKYFHESYYKEQFEKSFKEKYGKTPSKTDYPLLLTFGAHFSSVIGDSTTGLKSRDKLSLYHVDNHSVIDRFEYPIIQSVAGSVVERMTNEDELKKTHEYKISSSREESLRFYLKNGTEQLDHFYGLVNGYSNKDQWKLTDIKSSSPGVVSFSSRKIASSPALVTIQGEIADPETNNFKKGFVVLEDGKIKEVTTSLPSYAPQPIVKDVLIYPGLIDGHNHLKYNFFPLWVTNKFYNNRYEWPEVSSYTKGIKEVYKKVYTDVEECQSLADENQKNKCLANIRCDVLRFGEIKALLGGTTSLQGSTSFDETSSDITFRGLTPYYIGAGKKRTLSKARILENMLDACSQDAVQNLERISIDGTDMIRSTAQPITSEAFGTHQIGTEKFKSSGSAKLKGEYLNQSNFVSSNPETWKERTKAFYVHLGEGVDQSSREEWMVLNKLGLSMSQSVVIHGLGFDETDAIDMASKNVPMIWSPTSNALLYKQVAKIQALKKAGVLIGLGSDWSLSGTKSMLYELKVAKRVNEKLLKNVLSDHELFKMVTINNAKIAGLGSYLGKIEKGFSADFFLVEKKFQKSNPAETLMLLSESKIHSTWVKGVPQSGEYKNLEALVHDLNVDLKVFDLSKLDGQSCERAMGFATSDVAFQGLLKVVNRYKKAMNGLSPKIKNDLNSEFSNVDGFCQEKDQKALELTYKALGI